MPRLTSLKINGSYSSEVGKEGISEDYPITTSPKRLESDQRSSIRKASKESCCKSMVEI